LSKLSSVEAVQGKHDAARYYQNQAIKRSPTFLETHKSLINKDLLPNTLEEAAAMMAADPTEDLRGTQEVLKALEFWESRVEKVERNKTCWYPFKRCKKSNRKKDQRWKKFIGSRQPGGRQKSVRFAEIHHSSSG
jgi:hypothetical protein